MREMKNYLPSWRQSAQTTANTRRSKVIAGLIYDASMRFFAVIRSHKTSTIIERLSIAIFFTQSFWRCV
jgi:hypothetical protein